MKRVMIFLANLMWFISTIKDRLSWNKSKKDTANTQQNILFQIITDNKNTKFGKEYSFDKIDSIEEYQKQIPIQQYQGFENYIEEIANGEKNILTAQKVKLFEPSSGTSSSKKLIPYTDQLQKEFQRGINTWINQLYIKYPKLFMGKMYWSISPISALKYTRGGIPIGFMDDSEYLGSAQKLLKKTLMVMPNEITAVKDVKKFQYNTALFLLQEKNLSLISVWHPSFFILILDIIDKNSNELILEIEQKTDPKRASELRVLFQKYKNRSQLYEKIWKNLAVISCWGDAQAEFSFKSLKELFPNTPLESKGLIATEGFISFPNSISNAANLSIESHFFEFKDTTDDKILLSHELKVSKQYSVILTTSGGLYRYELGDIIEVTGFNETCPIIKFTGKKDYLVDMCGEKLSEIEVDYAIKKVLKNIKLEPSFWIFAPKRVNSSSSKYVLFIQIKNIENANIVSQEIDKELKRNFHYKYCRELGQLDNVGVFLIDMSDNPMEKFFDYSLSLGQQLGDIKPKSLHKRIDWDKEFLGEYLK